MQTHRPWTYLLLFIIISTAFYTVTTSFKSPKSAAEWGFFAHRRINRLAVFTLPPEMSGFYKKHIEFITEHAVDPDKRRYATKHEGPRHFIDIDHWSEDPFNVVPRLWTDALLKYADVYTINYQGDTTLIFSQNTTEQVDSTFLFLDADTRKLLKHDTINYATYRRFFKNNVLPQYYNDDWTVSGKAFKTIFPFPEKVKNINKVLFVDRFSEYGILPYHLDKMLRNLTKAFADRDLNKVLRYSAEIGHYIGDAHVPLHTTENYNGQLTNQVGIHAFWESRLPELFADEEYDYFVGKANYIDKPSDYYWQVIQDSHSYLDSVLQIERDLRKTFPSDQQFCYEERGGRTIRTQCTPFAKAYHERLDGQVEARFRSAVLTVGDTWYSAWRRAGQPDLTNFRELTLSEKEQKEQKETDTAFEKGKIKGRAHE